MFGIGGSCPETEDYEEQEEELVRNFYGENLHGGKTQAKQDKRPRTGHTQIVLKGNHHETIFYR